MNKVFLAQRNRRNWTRSDSKNSPHEADRSAEADMMSWTSLPLFHAGPRSLRRRPSDRPEYTVYGSPHFDSGVPQTSLHISTLGRHFKACKRLRLPFHYWPINSTISGSVTSICKPSKTSPAKYSVCDVCVCVCLGCPGCRRNVCQMGTELLFHGEEKGRTEKLAWMFLTRLTKLKCFTKITENLFRMCVRCRKH